MQLREILSVAFDSIRTNALRSSLTVLGIVIGIGAVIAMVALGEGAQRRVEDQIQRLGTNVLTVRPGQGMLHGLRTGSARLYIEDAEALRRVDGLAAVAPEIQSRITISYQRWNSSNTIIGTWPDYFDIYAHELQVGRVFDLGEVQGRRRVAVLGSQVPEQLGTPAAILTGRTIQIRGVPFEVIGVLVQKGEIGHSTPDDDVYIPVSTAQYRVLGGRDRLNAIHTQVSSPDRMWAAWGNIDQTLRREHRVGPTEDADFSVTNAADLMATFSEANRAFALLLAGIAAVSLLVGGIGIMNIMLVSVTERTREIGIRKAMGATRRAILFQFLCEALVLCSVGGLLGVLAGFGGARTMTRMADWQTAVSPNAVALAIAVSVSIGLFFGIWPARRASRLNPIDALRYE